MSSHLAAVLEEDISWPSKVIWPIAALTGALLIGGPALATDPVCSTPKPSPTQTNDPGVSQQVHVGVPMVEGNANGAVIVDVDVVVGEPAVTDIEINFDTPGGPVQAVAAGNANRPAP